MTRRPTRGRTTERGLRAVGPDGLPPSEHLLDADPVDEPGATNGGDAVAYPKTTRVDSHYHDCDEYWILLEGRATVVVGDAAMEMRPGDGVNL